jgi:glycosyltransferase involved in cell wall biosynthesis
MAPTVTIFIPTHNAAKTIKDTLVSCLNQTFRDFEIWVLENGSTDNTLEVLNEIKHEKIKVFSLGKVYQEGAFKYCLENSKSEFLARMDADDVMMPHRLQAQVDFLRNHPEYAGIGSVTGSYTNNFTFFEEKVDFQDYDMDLEGTAYYNYLSEGSFTFRRESALAVGGPDLEFPNHPLGFIFKILKAGKVRVVRDPFILVQVREDSISRTVNADQQIGIKIRQKYVPDYNLTLDRKRGREHVLYRLAVIELIAGNLRLSRRLILKYLRQFPNSTYGWKILAWTLLGIFGWRFKEEKSKKFKLRPDWQEFYRKHISMGDLNQKMEKVAFS